MLLAILNTCSKEELEEVDTSMEEAEARKKMIKNKILAVGRMARTFQTLRQESESINELKNITGQRDLPSGALASGAEGIRLGKFYNKNKFITVPECVINRLLFLYSN